MRGAGRKSFTRVPLQEGLARQWPGGRSGPCPSLGAGVPRLSPGRWRSSGPAPAAAGTRTGRGSSGRVLRAGGTGRTGCSLGSGGDAPCSGPSPSASCWPGSCAQPARGRAARAGVTPLEQPGTGDRGAPGVTHRHRAQERGLRSQAGGTGQEATPGSRSRASIWCKAQAALGRAHPGSCSPPGTSALPASLCWRSSLRQERQRRAVYPRRISASRLPRLPLLPVLRSPTGAFRSCRPPALGCVPAGHGVPGRVRPVQRRRGPRCPSSCGPGRTLAVANGEALGGRGRAPIGGGGRRSRDLKLE